MASHDLIAAYFTNLNLQNSLPYFSVKWQKLNWSKQLFFHELAYSNLVSKFEYFFELMIYKLRLWTIRNGLIVNVFMLYKKWHKIQIVFTKLVQNFPLMHQNTNVLHAVLFLHLQRNTMRYINNDILNFVRVIFHLKYSWKNKHIKQHT